MVFYDTLEEFYLAEALEDISACSKAMADHPIGTSSSRWSKSGGCAALLVRDVLGDVRSQDFVDEGLVRRTAPACFVVRNRSSTPGATRIAMSWATFAAERGPTDAPHLPPAGRPTNREGQRSQLFPR